MNRINLQPGCYTLPLGSDLLWWLAEHLAATLSLENITVILPTQRATDFLKYLLYKKNQKILNNIQITSYENIIPTSELETTSSFNTLWDMCSNPDLMMTTFQSLTPSIEQRQYWIQTTNNTFSELYAHEITPDTLSAANPQLRLLFDAYEKITDHNKQPHSTKVMIEKFQIFNKTIPNLTAPVYLIIDGYIPPKLQEIAVKLSINHHVFIYGHLTESQAPNNPANCYISLSQRLKEAQITPQPLSLYARRKPLIENLQNTLFKPANLSTSFKDIVFIESMNELSLAQQIITIAQDLFKEGKYLVTVVTPNRQLAHYIEIAASSVSIATDNSCGTLLSKTPFGHILLSFLEWMEHPENYKQLLTLINHPLLATYWGKLPSKLDAWGRNQEISFHKALSTYLPEDDQENLRLSDLIQLINTSWPCELPLKVNAVLHHLNMWNLDMDIFPEYTEIIENIKNLKELDMLKLLLNSITFRTTTPTGQHIRIMGPLEIRLMQPEIVILADMNEGEWPLPPTLNPWLPSGLRESLGLPATHQITTITSKIFLSLLGCKYVYLCRTTHSNGQITSPSRWWERLKVLSALNQTTISHFKQPPPHYDAKEIPSLFKIPQELTPKRLSISDLHRWINDPKTFVLKSVLNLNELPVWEEAADHRDKGIMIHDILDTAVRQNLSFDAMLKLMSHQLDLLHLQPHERMFWESYTIKCLQHFQTLHQESPSYQIWTEIKGEHLIKTKFGDITLVGKADRIEKKEDGSIHIIDYKTGTTPAKNSVYKGLVPQLPILGLMLESGAFSKIPATTPFMVSYWNLKDGSAINFLFEEIRHLEQIFITAIERLLDPDTIIELND